MAPKRTASHRAAAIRRLAEERLRAEGPALTHVDPLRVLHELQVHQIQLEMQNAELRDARFHLEVLVDKYSDLYDFAPVGYFSLDATACIREVNLKGAAMLGVERSRLLRRLFSGFVAPAHRSTFTAFLKRVFSGNSNKVCEVELDNGADGVLCVNLQGTFTAHEEETEPLCRLAVTDITELKRAMEAQSRLEALNKMNEALEAEVSKRRITEKSLRESKRRQSCSLTEARRMQEQLRVLSHQILHIQEEERRRISVDLHDEIAQTLVAINVHLASLARETRATNSRISEKIMDTQKLVQQSVESVHRFAMGLRPSVLDDLGLIPALQGCARDFTEQTEIPVHFKAPSGLKPLGATPTVALYRVAQAALSNIAQHAAATKVRLTLSATQRSLRMEITDDGKGFDLNKARTGKQLNRLGLIGMQERVEMVGGKFTVLSSPGKGTTIRVTLSLAKAHLSNASKGQS